MNRIDFYNARTKSAYRKVIKATAAIVGMTPEELGAALDASPVPPATSTGLGRGKASALSRARKYGPSGLSLKMSLNNSIQKNSLTRNKGRKRGRTASPRR